MPKPKPITVYIDGEKVGYRGELGAPNFGDLAMSGLSGTSGSAKGCEIIGHERFGTVWVLAIWGKEENGDYWDINGIYETGEFGKMEDGSVYYSVEKRIA